MTFDASTGRELWRAKEDVFGTMLVAGVKHDALLMSYQSTAFKLPSEKGGRLAVYRASDGKRLWEKSAATLGYHDFSSSKGTTNYGGIRPGCWINAVPAGGLVLVPDATTKCKCSYLNQAWMALQPRD